MVMTQDKKPILVDICGTEYPIQADADPEYIKKVARYVDDKMRKVTGEKISPRTVTKVAVQVALNVTDELFQERTEKEALLAQIDELTTRLAEELRHEAAAR